ncbi:MAG: OB-fold nucleic acid binding domain-containing protein [Methanolinea sp.]|nr:OB-fold nucleic acid binding domain-containing protein [Methanolinea sp.]
MQFHYALVDDLVSREEFERRVEEKMEACGDLVDEVTAAMMVVQDLGRHHVKIAKLGGRSSLFSFFGKVIAKNPVREFERPSGEKGLVTSLILGDETGQVRAILWDEKAHASQEIEPGDVLEVIGRHSGHSASEITVLAMRPAPVEIAGPSEVAPHLAPPRRKDVCVRVIAIGDARKVTRRDGSEAEMVDLIVGNGKEVTRMVCWVPELLDSAVEGMTLKIKSVLEKTRKNGKEYSIDEKSSVEVSDEEVPVSLGTLDSIAGPGTYSLIAPVRECHAAHPFTTRDGRTSLVRNLVVSDGTHELRVVLWEEHAKMEFLPGEDAAFYLCTAKQGKTGDWELHAGRGSLVQVIPPSLPVEEEITGDVIISRGSAYLDTGEDCSLISGQHPPHGHMVRARVLRAGKRVRILSWEDVVPDAAETTRMIDDFVALPSRKDTFTPHGRQDICE